MERGREMFSARLCKEDFLELKRALKGRDKKAERLLDAAISICWASSGSARPGSFMRTSIDDFAYAVLSTELDRLREEGLEPELDAQVLEFWFTLRDFLNTADLLDEIM